ncbi:FCD domain-containing protein [Thauera mechernichensis]|uniref:FCD domain-containing protein n=1 Tax=Thauera mechernichensis TaxID=82788 RepID=A0ABW3WCY9_9RHOO|nr:MULTISPECIES: FCD domain-containing protein [Thauera]ENO79341.1 transcriptional regulator [Thauera sp. 27]MDG3066996.1 FCD domain-containing protein [Thauera mechernichensis]HAG76668.1 FCD domain-containing protein [Thauera sp.]HNR61645.1 FCD domain-containing protein [Thauera sp.]
MSEAALLSNAAAEPKTLVEGAYQRLRRDIIEGVHAPGEKLRVEHLKDQYDVGAGTLREALLLLVTDALVVTQGQRGFRVAPISIADFEDITRTRVLLETEALRQSITLGGDDWEASVVAAFHRLSRAEEKLADHDPGTTEEWEKRNRAFHEALISASPSRWIRHFQNILYQQSERYRRISLFRQPIERDIHAEHQALFDATLARDTTRATSILTEHILRTLDAVKRMPTDFFTGKKKL